MRSVWLNVAVNFKEILCVRWMYENTNMEYWKINDVIYTMLWIVGNVYQLAPSAFRTAVYAN